MKTPNLAAIRAELPRGSIVAIAEKIGIAPKKVTEYFHNGWHQQYSGAILSEAMEIIRAKAPDDEVVEEFENMGLTGGFNPIVARKRRSDNASRGSGSTLGWLLGIAGIAVGAYFVVPEVKNFIDEKIFSKKKANLTPEEEQAAAVAAAKTK